MRQTSKVAEGFRQHDSLLGAPSQASGRRGEVIGEREADVTGGVRGEAHLPKPRADPEVVRR